MKTPTIDHEAIQSFFNHVFNSIEMAEGKRFILRYERHTARFTHEEGQDAIDTFMKWSNESKRYENVTLSFLDKNNIETDFLTFKQP